MVRVSQISYPLSVVQGSLDSALDVASTITGEAVSDEERQAGVQDIVTSARSRWTIFPDTALASGISMLPPYPYCPGSQRAGAV